MDKVSLKNKKKKLVITHLISFLIKIIAVFVVFLIGSIVLSLLIQNTQISTFVKHGFCLVPNISIKINVSHLWLIGSLLSVIIIGIMDFKNELKDLKKQIKQEISENTF
ncbi:MAG: hypothetical protein J7L26_04115 [Candidatus Aminicenantes bacterium]|nr:hypothetical protein [Candidatus Aminicenantes bacterium]